MASINKNDNDEAVNPYLAMREAKIARNEKRLIELGLLKPPPPPKQKAISKKPQQRNEPVRRSNRISSQEIQPDYKDGESYRKRTRDTDTEGASSDRTLSASTRKTRAYIPTKETSPKIAPAPSADSVRSISLDIEYLVLGHSKDHTDGLLGKMLERPGKDYVVHKSFAEAAYPEDRQRLAGGESKKLSFNKYSGVQEWKVSFIRSISGFNSYSFECALNRCAIFTLHVYRISQLMLLRIAYSCGSTSALKILRINSYMTEIKSRGMVGRDCMNRLRCFTN
jgi:hypothetical protein